MTVAPQTDTSAESPPTQGAEDQVRILAERFLSLWQEQLALWSFNPPSPELMGQDWQRFLHDAQFIQRPPGPFNGGPFNGGGSSGGASAAATAAPSDELKFLVPQLQARIAALEARLAALESRLNRPGG